MIRELIKENSKCRDRAIYIKMDVTNLAEKAIERRIYDPSDKSLMNVDFKNFGITHRGIRWHGVDKDKLRKVIVFIGVDELSELEKIK